MTKSIVNILSENLVRIRKNRNLSQEKLAEMIGIESSSLSRIESCKSFPKPETIDKIVEVLQIEHCLLFITDKNFNIDKAYDETLKSLEKLKNDKSKFKLIYDLTKDLTN